MHIILIVLVIIATNGIIPHQLKVGTMKLTENKLYVTLMMTMSMNTFLYDSKMVVSG